MKAAFDTSVLVAAAVAAHPHHARARAWTSAAARGDLRGVMSWHAVAEAWSVLTRLPLSPPVSARAAREAIDSLRAAIPARALLPETYLSALARCEENRMSSGAVFDALHVVCAEEAEADVILTFNRGHFLSLSRAGGPRVIVPPDPPSTDVDDL